VNEYSFYINKRSANTAYNLDSYAKKTKIVNYERLNIESRLRYTEAMTILVVHSVCLCTDERLGGAVQEFERIEEYKYILIGCYTFWTSVAGKYRNNR